jgi:hypothetical protein
VAASRCAGGVRVTSRSQALILMTSAFGALILAPLLMHFSYVRVGAFEEPDNPLQLDPERFALVSIGMPEEQVIEILGEPYSGPALDFAADGEVPDKTNREECEQQRDCACAAPVKMLYYYRGSLGESLKVFVGADGRVCCYNVSHSMYMSFGSVWH